MKLAITLWADERDLVLLALAILSLDRPGWLQNCEDAAASIGGEQYSAATRAAFGEFRRLNADRWSHRL